MPTKKRTPVIPPLSAEDIEKLTEHLLELSDCDYVSITDLKLNYQEIVSKLYRIGRPLLLRIGGYSLLLCDPEKYINMERKRLWLIDGCKQIGELIQLGKVKLPNENIRKLSALKLEIEDTKTERKTLRYELAQATAKIAQMQKEADLIRRRLRILPRRRFKP